jgi:hypothetical protein
MPTFKGVQFLYGALAVIGTLFAAVGFMGFVISLCTWDVTTAGVCALFGAFFAFFASVMGLLMEE